MPVPRTSSKIVDRTGHRLLPIGSEDFAEVVTEHVYVDKTSLICGLLDSSYKVTLLCRPRRFGKSLAMRMLQCFFETPVEGAKPPIPSRKAIFESLSIWRAGERYRAQQGGHPVIFLSLGSAGGRTWDSCRAGIMGQMSDEYARHAYLLDGSLLPEEKARFRRVIAGTLAPGEAESSLSWLSLLLLRHHGSGTVILIDEYDHPVSAGHLNGYRDEVIGFMRSWLTAALKATTSLYRAYLTGVQRVGRESVFSGLNNVVVNTAMDTRFTEGFGFTREEAGALARYMGLPQDKLSEMHDWYDGYCFGGTAIYNPWSILNYLDLGGVAQPYWGNTSDNAIVHRLFQQADARLADDLRTLASGRRLERPLNLATVFSELDLLGGGASPSALWGQLYLAGYVTTDDIAFPNDDMMPRRLRLPNREVAWLYRREFTERTQSVIGDLDLLLRLRQALVSGDEAALARSLDELLTKSPSYFDLVSENSYHMLLLGLVCDLPGYRFPLSNRESGDGRPDIVLIPELEHQNSLAAIVIEVKDVRGTLPGSEGLATAEGGLDLLAKRTLAQARGRRYGADLPGRGLLFWGVAFRGKVASCKCRRMS